MFDKTTNMHQSVVPEKQLNGWLRAKKETPAESTNQRWQDLSRNWFGEKKSLRADPSFRPG